MDKETLSKNLASLEAKLKAMEGEREAREREFAALHAEMAEQDKAVAKLAADRKLQGAPARLSL